MIYLQYLNIIFMPKILFRISLIFIYGDCIHTPKGAQIGAPPNKHSGIFSLGRSPPPRTSPDESPLRPMSCRIIQTSDEVVFISNYREDETERLRVVTIRSQPEEPVLTSRFHPRWSCAIDQAPNDMTPTSSNGSRWSCTPE